MVITFKEFLVEKAPKKTRNWKRALKVGGTTIAASALAGAARGGFGLGPIGGAAIGAGLGAAYYTLGGHLKKDLSMKRKDWNYNKK